MKNYERGLSHLPGEINTEALVKYLEAYNLGEKSGLKAENPY